MYELPVREIRDGKVCRINFDDWSQAQAGGYCPLPADGPYIMLLVMRAADDHHEHSWSALYGETFVEVYEAELRKLVSEP